MTIRAFFTRRVLALLLLWTAFVAVAAEITARRRVGAYMEIARSETTGQARILATTLSGTLSSVRGVGAVYHDNPRVLELLAAVPPAAYRGLADSIARRATLSARPDVAALSSIFAANVRAVNGLDALFLTDAEGMILASSDRESAASRIGRFYTRNALLTRARGEDVVQLYAPNVITGRPGLVFGSAVMQGAHFLGVVVARSEADGISDLLRDSQAATVLVSDSAGRVIIASDPTVILHRIATAEAMTDSTAARLPLVGTKLGPAYAGPGRDVELRRAWVVVPLDEFGLTLHIVRELPGAEARANDTRLIGLLVWVAGVLLLLAWSRSRIHLAETAAAEARAVAEGKRVGDLLNTSYDAVVSLDVEHRVVDWNARAEVMFGYSAEEMVGTDPTDRIIPERWRGKHGEGFGVVQHIGRSDAFGKPREVTALNRRGLEFPVEITMSPAKGVDGGTIFVAFFRDVSVRKREEAERALVAERVDRYRSVVMDLSEREREDWAIGLRDILREAKRAIEVERASFWRLDDAVERMTCECQLVGATEDAESAGLTLTRDESPGYFRALRRRQPIVATDAVRHEATKEFASSYLVPTGVGSVLDTPVWFEGREVGVVSFHHIGAPRAWEAETVEFATTIAARIGALMESVRRVESERALNEERARMEVILRLSPIGQVLWDSDKGLMYANPAIVSLFAYPSDEGLRGKFPWELSPPLQPDGSSSQEAGRAAVAECMRTGRHAFEWTFRRLDGSDFPASVTLVRLSEGGTQRLSTIIDLTEVKAAQAAIIAAKEAAEQAEAAKSAFLATMSHEIRTPMNGVMSMAEMLDQTDLDDDQRSMLQVVRTSADALLTIINDILDVSKIEAGKMTLEEVELSPAAIAEDVVTLLSPRAQDKGVGLYAEVMPQVPGTVLGDPTRLRQIVVNLTGNALKFTEKGFVRVRVSTNQLGELRLEISDTGIGLTPDQRSKLFQPFVQADSSTARKFGGTGLGLSICKKLVEMMHGRIGVDSTYGSGSTFWIEVPLAAWAPPPSPEVDISDLQVMLAGFPAEQARILDEYVQGAGGKPALVYNTTSAALQRLRSDAGLTPVVVFPTYPDDYPGGALQLARALRELPGREKTPVCLVVPSTLISSASAAAQTGFIATTTEPVRRERFWRMLAVSVGRAQAERRAKQTGGREFYEAPPMHVAAAKGAVLLVAEDNKTNQIVISRLLSQLGLAHEIADNGIEALKLLDAKRPSYGLLLTDFHMPEMDGFELTAAWRAREREGDARGHLPILALTADALAGMADRCKEAGMDGYLTKPIVRDALIEELERWLPVAFELRTEVHGPGKGKNAAAEATLETVVGAPATAASGDVAEAAIDYAEFAKQLGIETGPDATELLGSLWESVAGLGDDLQRALAARERVALREVAHGGKGAARSIGAVRLGDLCAALQDEAEALSWEVLAEKVAAAVAEHERVGEQVAAMTR